MTYDLIMETDQTECFDETGVKMACSGSGQDGERRKQPPGPAPRFVVEGRIVEDTWTGLIWCQDAALTEFPLTWQESLAYVARMNMSGRFGHQAWQLPSKRDLFSLISHKNINPSLPESHPFVNVFTGYYWTGTTCARIPDQAWYAHLGGGRIYRGMKQNAYMVWPVSVTKHPLKGSIFLHTPRFVVEGITVRDARHGRMWYQPADLNEYAVTWTQALKTVAQLNRQAFAGYRDWRLPNIRELESLTDIKEHSPALPENHPFEKVKEGYWSSTTSVYEPSYAWVLYTVDGAVGVGHKPRPEFYVWAVRSI